MIFCIVLPFGIGSCRFWRNTLTTYLKGWRYMFYALVRSTPYLFLILGVTWKNIFHNGYVVQPELITFYGGNCSLNWGYTTADSQWHWIHPQVACRSHWIPLGARSAWWQASCSCIHTSYRPPGHHIKGMLNIETHWIEYYLIRLWQIGWITLDNASNNDTFMTYLELLLAERGINFVKIKQCIR